MESLGHVFHQPGAHCLSLTLSPKAEFVSAMLLSLGDASFFQAESEACRCMSR